MDTERNIRAMAAKLNELIETNNRLAAEVQDLRGRLEALEKGGVKAPAEQKATPPKVLRQINPAKIITKQ